MQEILANRIFTFSLDHAEKELMVKLLIADDFSRDFVLKLFLEIPFFDRTNAKQIYKKQFYKQVNSSAPPIETIYYLDDLPRELLLKNQSSLKTCWAIYPVMLKIKYADLFKDYQNVTPAFINLYESFGKSKSVEFCL